MSPLPVSPASKVAPGHAEAPVILVVEDHGAMRRLLAAWLQECFPASTVQTASSGEEALALVRGKSPDLALIDIELPGIDGIETARRLRQAVAKVRIVMLSIAEDAHYRNLAGAAGADMFVAKRDVHHALLPIVTCLLACDSRKTS
ncbi:MAG TPA: response regulator transcription factor [Gammaproteobacteria bacterium]|nr:response regulator transcription factor [Gammaproteobacteria bacterium]